MNSIFVGFGAIMADLCIGGRLGGNLPGQCMVVYTEEGETLDEVASFRLRHQLTG
jgi:hypothetical protein